ncbi:MAG: glycosyltransferase family 1 protein [Thermodesulfobacteriota bacterium]
MIRVLHVLGGTERGGIETWVLNVLRKLDRTRFSMDILVHEPERGAYEDEMRDLGARILRCPHFRRPWKYAFDFVRYLSTFGPYEVVHTHGGYFSGLNMLLAMLWRVPVRIVHSHNDLRWLRQQEGLSRQLYYLMMGVLVRRCSTMGLAASRDAAEDYYGIAWESSGKFSILPCGVDLEPFSRPYDAHSVRRELGLPPEALVIGHVGRFTLQKNHPFILEIFREVLIQDPKAVLVLAGDGLLEPHTRTLVKQMNMGDKVLFLGSRPDIPRLLITCIDVFLFPSLFEGLGLALVEAQAAGLRCVISDAIPEEADLVPDLVTRLSLSQPPGAWAEALLATARKPVPVSSAEALAVIASSPYNIHQSVKSLERVYEDSVFNSRARALSMT